ncbi:hypothetical protein BS47DRAFT_1364723 [Hydnum rufescens UP504]|uniref:Uncharacterized protein n=1 Tax=Hydnum rufescens UP504 TaxID=1448309 RepID=A0A9P6AQU9_9AGAM|nr:hypothetical protein BS47DRAFT_1364723 [Hydnum rufescens UP504]
MTCSGKESLNDCRRWHIQTYERLKGLILQNHWNILLLTRHLPKSSSKLLVAHKKSKAKKSYYKHKSDSDSSSSSSSDSSDDESPAKEPESDSDSEVPVRATTSPKKAVVHHKAPVIPTIRNVADQVGELARSFDEMKIHFARSLPNDNPCPNSNQVHPQTSSPATYPNNYPLGMPQNQYTNKSAEGSGNNLVCWFCDKVGTHNVGMKNCPDAQAMIRQNLIKYSIKGQLVKMDGSRLPRGIPGQGGFKQAIIDEIKRFGSDIPNTSHSGACSLVDDYAAKQEKPNVRFTPMVEPPKEHKVTVEIPPRNLAKPNSENHPKHPAEPTAAPKVNPVPERKQDACEDKDIAEKVLDQMIEISLGDFLGTAIGPAKILASRLKLKKEPTGKYREPLTVNIINSTAYQDTQELENAEYLDSSDEEPMYKDIYPPGQQHPLKWLYKSHMLKAKRLLAMATGKIQAKVAGEEDVILMLDTGSKLNLISKETLE